MLYPESNHTLSEAVHPTAIPFPILLLPLMTSVVTTYTTAKPSALFPYTIPEAIGRNVVPCTTLTHRLTTYAHLPPGEHAALYISEIKKTWLGRETKSLLFVIIIIIFIITSSSSSSIKRSPAKVHHWLYCFKNSLLPAWPICLPFWPLLLLLTSYCHSHLAPPSVWSYTTLCKCTPPVSCSLKGKSPSLPLRVNYAFIDIQLICLPLVRLSLTLTLCVGRSMVTRDGTSIRAPSRREHTPWLISTHSLSTARQMSTW